MFLITVVTIFPEMFPGPLMYGIAGKRLRKLWDIKTINIRDFARDKHRKVDDTTYGGGPGMVMRPDVVHDAMTAALAHYEKKPKILFMTPRGEVFSNKVASRLTDGNEDGLIILCGRYEGVDQRVIDHWKSTHGMDEISIGDYILFGGEIPAIVVIDSCIRLIPDMINNALSVVNESFSLDLLEHSQYTKPAVWNGAPVPEVLLSGDHGMIDRWRTECAERMTKAARPDLWERYAKQDNER
ncbi:MAG: tRNA (guanosine(37)-N1)-methyltransferase TrmD [Holosporales bacterium]|jgi:tRNA (guanine37-N1)-methyltransferase|nr:tRNA (guanosine(37)-N1)-methyltransferase TrmD [Holosporales bacterium]